MARHLQERWRSLTRWLRPEPISTADAFKTFLAQRAALIAQKCAIDYCRGKTGLASYALFTEKPFLEALDVCRWETFVAVLEDLVILAEGLLRPHVPSERQGRLAAGLIDMHSAILASHALPAHRPLGWSDVGERFAIRLRAASTAAPQQALQLADHSAKRLFDTLPIHITMRELDEEVVYGAVRFRMVATSQEMRRRVRAADVAAGLTL